MTVRPVVCHQGRKDLRALRGEARTATSENDAWSAFRRILQIKYRHILEGDKGTQKLLDGYHMYRHFLYEQGVTEHGANFSLLADPSGRILGTYEWVYSGPKNEAPEDKGLGVSLQAEDYNC